VEVVVLVVVLVLTTVVLAVVVDMSSGLIVMYVGYAPPLQIV
jgi:hypothetical protein